MNDIPIPPAVTLYWQEERIKELEGTVKHLRSVIATHDIERRQLQTLLAACQKALREMQAQRDAAREGKR